MRIYERESLRRFSITSSPRPANEAIARLSLETGSGPAFEPALKLYRKYGFIDGGAFGGYEKSPFNQFLHLDMGRSQRTAVASDARNGLAPHALER